MRATPAEVAPGVIQRAMEQSAVSMALVSPSGTFMRVNAATAALLGVPADRLIGTSVQQVTHPEDLADDRALLDQVRAGLLDSYRLSKRYLRPDGSVVFADLTVTGVRDDAGELVLFLAQIVDVTEQTLARLDARASREQLRGVIDSLLDPWVMLAAVRDPSGAVVDFEYVDANDAACKANHRSRSELLGSRLLDMLPGHEGTGLLKQYAAVVDTGRPLLLDDCPYPSELTDGSVRWFDNRAVKVGDGLSFTWRDVTDRVVQRHRLASLAASDPLTGLANRQFLMESLEDGFGTPARRGEMTAVLYCDLDRFKLVNDTLGHEAGDVVLRSVADRIRSSVREQDLVARIGGDEFVVVARGIRNEATARALADTIESAVRRPVLCGSESVVPSLSVGVSVGFLGKGAEDMIRLADRSLYERKALRADVAGPAA
jgi:diguanylate cyclase (GGDEF)-like protein/PAS domain S-box-containing protein